MAEFPILKNFRELLGKTLESNIISIKVGKHGMIDIRNIILHTVINTTIPQNIIRLEKNSIKSKFRRDK